MDSTEHNEGSLEDVRNLLPFVCSIANDGIKHHELLNAGQSVGMRSGFVSLQPGQNVGSHSTRNNEELLVILDGSGEVDLEGVGRRRIHKSCVAYIPPHTRHDVFNTSSEPLRYVYVVSRCGG
jgi:mannose-6-phosphate isomerase-like protein (cupin superfamily)